MKLAFRKNWIFILAATTMATVLLAAAGMAACPVSAQEEPERVAIGSDMLIDSGEVVEGDVSVTNGNLVLKGEVRGDVTVVNGNAEIEGKVAGDVAVTSGKVVLDSEGEVGRSEEHTSE